MASTAERGREHEERAVAELVSRGYQILERNYRCKAGEIDVVARQGDTLIFVEVRSRTDGNLGSALDTVDRRKRQRIARVAQHYLSFEQPTFEHCRFDVVGITAGELVIIEDAFRLGELA